MIGFEFHISLTARRKYNFDDALFGLDGRVVVADFAAARRLAENMTRLRGYVVPASDINALGLIDEILHILIRQYEKQNPGVMRRALEAAGEDVEAALLKFTEEFPPRAVYPGGMSPRHYLDLETDGRPHRQSTLEEMLILHITNLNPAAAPYKDLFDDEPLKQATPYEQAMARLKQFFQGEPPFGATDQTVRENRCSTPCWRPPASLPTP